MPVSPLWGVSQGREGRCAANPTIALRLMCGPHAGTAFATALGGLVDTGTAVSACSVFRCMPPKNQVPTAYLGWLRAAADADDR